MRRGLKPFCVLALSVLLLFEVVPFGMTSGEAVLRASAGVAPRIAIIVGEPSFESGEPRSQGNSAEARNLRVSAASSSIARYLSSVGYTPGTDLFEVELSGLRDLSGGALQLSAAVKEAMRAGAERASSLGPVGVPRRECDIIASGLSGLIARYALEKGYLNDFEVVNLVMASSPNRGTFLAGVVKSILEIVRQESILEKETRAERFLPSIRDILSAPEDPDLRVKDLTKARALTPPEWEDEASWISIRSASLWEPLYAEYVEARYFALPYLPSESPKETYAGWVRRTFPEVWRRLISDAAWVKEDQQDLSLPYYEYLSMVVAKNRYVMRMASCGSLVDSLFKEPFIPTGWKEAAVHYGLKILRHYAEKALITVKAEVQERIAYQAVNLTGLGSGPESPFISGLVKEDLLINLGTSSSKRFERIPANISLSGLNKSSRERARVRDTRYVSVCSRLANPWALIWPELAPNDSLLEVDSGVPPMGPYDLAAVFGGLFRLPGKSVLDDRKAQEYIARVLGGAKGGLYEKPAGEPGQGSLLTLEVSSWGPRWCSTGASARVTLGVTSLPDGWQCQVWEEYLEPGASQGWKQGLMWAFDAGGNYVVRLSPGTVRLGFRLVRSGPLNPILGSTVKSAYSDEVLLRVFVALAEDEAPGPVEPSGPAVPPGDGAGDAGGGDDGCDDSDEGAGGEKPGGADGGTETPGSSGVGVGGGDDGYDLPPDLPTVRVVYRSKHTTLKKPKETVHGYWVVDFGDGSRETIEGQPFLTVEHTYLMPGDYGAIAESYTCDGTLLYSEAWDVFVALAGETRRLTCASVAPVVVNMALNGPEKWVTGKFAVFSVGAEIELPPNAELLSIKYDPGSTFGVIWERAGDFVVGAAASIIVKYSLEDASIEVENTYLHEVPVTVLTTGVTQ